MTDPAERSSILVVDDDDVFASRLCRAFEDRGFDVARAGDYDGAVALATADSPEFAVVDLRMPGPSGLELVMALKRLDPSTRVVVLTGFGSIATALEAVRLGATHYLTKPADADSILEAFHRGELGPESPPSALPEVPSLARVEWEHIHRILSDCQGNISEAARKLGIHRRSLQRKLAKYPVSR